MIFNMENYQFRGTFKKRLGDADGFTAPLRGVVGRTTPFRVLSVTTFYLSSGATAGLRFSTI